MGVRNGSANGTIKTVREQRSGAPLTVRHKKQSVFHDAELSADVGNGWRRWVSKNVRMRRLASAAAA